MNCPLCGQQSEEDTCPNCGAVLIPPAEPEASRELPGIFLENLLTSQAEAREERRQPDEPRYDRRERRGIALCLLLLLGVLGGTWWMSGRYDPDAAAVLGRNGISVDNETFAIYYQTELKELESQYSQQDTPLPFDLSRSLEKQYVNLETGYSWADYFREQALSSVSLTESLVAQARQADFQPSGQRTDAFEASLSSLPQTAAAGGYVKKDGSGDVEAYLLARYGTAVSRETYEEYLRDTFLAQCYSDMLYQTVTYSDQELRDYYQENRQDYSDTPLSELPDVQVRHILLIPEEDSQAARQDTVEQAQAMAEALMEAGGSEEGFALLARQYSGDTGSRDNGGLLEDVAPGQIGEEFSAWCFAAGGHSYGDMGVVCSDYGVHLLFFVGYTDTYRWKETVLGDMRSEELARQYALLLEENDCYLTRFALAPPMETEA